VLGSRKRGFEWGIVTGFPSRFRAVAAGVVINRFSLIAVRQGAARNGAGAVAAAGVDPISRLFSSFNTKRL